MPDNPQPITLQCRACGRQFDVPLDKAEGTNVCPYCGGSAGPASVEDASTGLKTPESARADRQENDEYEVAAPIERAPAVLPIDMEEPEGFGATSPGAAVDPPTADRDSPPDTSALRVRPEPEGPIFFSGTFSFPWQRSAWPRWLLLSSFTLVVWFLIYWVIEWSSTNPMGAVLVIPPLVLIVGPWIVLISVHVTAIVQDTSEGLHEVFAWPDLSQWLDWFMESLFVVSSAAIAAIAGYGVSRCFNASGNLSHVGLFAGSFFVFPVALLSTLDSGSPLIPVSRPIWASLYRVVGGWITFYLAAAILAAVVLIPTWFAIQYYPRASSVVLGPYLAAGVMVYARLLGRLGWHCAVQTAEEEADTDEEERSDGGEA